VHPTTTDIEVSFICNALKTLANNIENWSKDYKYDPLKNDYIHNSEISIEKELVDKWFTF